MASDKDDIKDSKDKEETDQNQHGTNKSDPADTNEEPQKSADPIEQLTAREKLEYLNNHIYTGFLVLFDIKDSTSRKHAYKRRWILQTSAFYESFAKFIKELKVKIQIPWDEPVVKLAGDGCMLFIPHLPSRDEKQDLNIKNHSPRTILREVMTFRQIIHDDTELSGLRLKIVITYLTNIHRVKVNDTNDVLGRGIDFSFRLERFADSTHLVVNKYFIDVLRDKGRPNEISLSKLEKKILKHVIPCRKRMKGWASLEGESFYLITEPDDIENFLDAKPSPERGDVHTELMAHFIKHHRKKQTANSTDPINIDISATP
ncbi:MAG: hypothetical protein HQL54_12195 [Magnetococcales bacterium]|nr:hypothetical protein [Magnetococcales bacterium]